MDLELFAIGLLAIGFIFYQILDYLFSNDNEKKN